MDASDERDDNDKRKGILLGSFGNVDGESTMGFVGSRQWYLMGSRREVDKGIVDVGGESTMGFFQCDSFDVNGKLTLVLWLLLQV